VSRAFLIASALALLLALAPAASAAPFQAAVTLSAPGLDARAPSVAVNASGEALAVWLSGAGDERRVQAASRRAGGLFGAASNLSAAGKLVGPPAVALDVHGAAVVLWRRQVGSSLRLEAAVRPPGGELGAPQLVAPSVLDQDNEWGAPQVAFNPAGDAVAVFTRAGAVGESIDWHAQAAVLPAGATVFGRPFELAPAERWSANPRIAFAASGTATLAWRAAASGEYWRIQAATWPADGSVGAPQTLSDPSHHSELQKLAVDAAGDAVIAWRGVRGIDDLLQASVRPAGGAFAAARTLSRPVGVGSSTRHRAGSPRTDVGVAGGALVVWRESDGEKRRVHVSAGAAGGALGAPTILSAPGRHAGAPRVGIDAAGNAVAIWKRRSDAERKYRLLSAIRPAGGAFGPTVDLSAGGRNAVAPELAVGAAGDAIAIWRRYDGTHWRVQAAWAQIAQQPVAANVAE